MTFGTLEIQVNEMKIEYCSEDLIQGLMQGTHFLHEQHECTIEPLAYHFLPMPTGEGTLTAQHSSVRHARLQRRFIWKPGASVCLVCAG